MKIIHMFLAGGAKKAIAGGIGATALYLAPVVDDGLSWSEVLYALGALLVGSGLVYAAPKNKQPTV